MEITIAQEPRQLDLLDNAIAVQPADPLIGLILQLPFDCNNCGSKRAALGDGAGPHRASLHCSTCNKHRGWLP
jgi:hypothetical protein